MSDGYSILSCQMSPVGSPSSQPLAKANLSLTGTNRYHIDHYQSNRMKFTLPTLIALFTALPAFAFELPKADPFTLSQSLAMEIVTPWTDADIKGGTEGKEDEVQVDDHMYHKLYTFSFDKGATVVGAGFALWRESWKDHYLGVSLPHTAT